MKMKNTIFCEPYGLQHAKYSLCMRFRSSSLKFPDKSTLQYVTSEQVVFCSLLSSACRLVTDLYASSCHAVSCHVSTISRKSRQAVALLRHLTLFSAQRKTFSLSGCQC